MTKAVPVNYIPSLHTLGTQDGISWTVYPADKGGDDE